MSLGDANDPAWSGYDVRLVTCPCCDGAGEWDEGPLPASSGASEPEYRQVICPQCEGSGKDLCQDRAAHIGRHGRGGLGVTSYQCVCMDGPNHPDPACLYCGGTGEYVSDARLSELCGHYSYLTEYNDGHGRKDFGPSDRQHVAIFKALQLARAAKLKESHRPKE